MSTKTYLPVINELLQAEKSGTLDNYIDFFKGYSKVDFRWIIGLIQLEYDKSDDSMNDAYEKVYIFVSKQFRKEQNDRIIKIEDEHKAEITNKEWIAFEEAIATYDHSYHNELQAWQMSDSFNRGAYPSEPFQNNLARKLESVLSKIDKARVEAIKKKYKK